MKELIRMIVTLVIISLVAGMLLALANNATKAPIENARKAELEIELKKVLPPTDNNLLDDTFSTNLAGRNWTFYIGRYKGEYAGVAVKSWSEKGYGGRIEVLVGIRNTDDIHGVSILKSQETPGLGTRIAEPAFLKQFKGLKTKENNAKNISITRDGGEIQAITGATISSRAVTEAVRNAMETYLACMSAIKSTVSKEKTTP